jgi:hypothetical protein
VALHGREKKNQSEFFRQLVEGTIEMGLKLAGGGHVFARLPQGWLRPPERFALFTAFCRPSAVEREPERNAHEPGAKTAAVTQPIEAAVSAKQSFLRDVLGVRSVPQHAACDAISQRPALSEALLELAAHGSLGCFARQFPFCSSIGLDQDQLLHPFSPYSSQTPPSRVWFNRKIELSTRGMRSTEGR